MAVRDITVHQLETHTFHQIPQMFTRMIKKEWNAEKTAFVEVHRTSPYVKLSSDAKLAYGMLLSRCQLSIQSYQLGDRKYVDSHGAVFMIYTVSDLARALDKSKGTAIKIKKELIAANLLREVRQGKNKPNRLYLQNVDATLQLTEYYDENSTLIKREDYLGRIVYENSDQSDQISPSLDTSGSSNFGLPKLGLPEVQNLNPSKKEIRQIENKDDTNRNRDDFPLQSKRVANILKLGNHAFLTKDTISLLGLFGKDAKMLENKIFQAKRFVEKECADLTDDNRIYGEIWADDVGREVQKLVFKVKTGETEGKPIQDLGGYFYAMMVQFWKLAFLAEQEQGIISLTARSEAVKASPQHFSGLLSSFYPQALSRTELEERLVNALVFPERSAYVYQSQ